MPFNFIKLLPSKCIQVNISRISSNGHFSFSWQVKIYELIKIIENSIRFYVIRWLYGTVTCQLFAFVRQLLGTFQIGALTLLAVERYLCTRPKRKGISVICKHYIMFTMSFLGFRKWVTFKILHDWIDLFLVGFCGVFYSSFTRIWTVIRNFIY